MNEQKPSFSWILKMAWRDSRKNRSRLLLFISSIVLGIAALVAINSFSDNLQQDIEGEAKALLGADLVVESRQPIPDSTVQFFDALDAEQSREVSFASMVLFPKNDGTRLVQVRALEGEYPYYGDIETEPLSASREFRGQLKALADNTLMLQYDAEPGDSIKVGELSFLLEGRINKVPGQPGITATVAPPVYIPMEYLEETGLLQKGSRLNYKLYLKFPDGTDVTALLDETIEPFLDKADLRFDDVEERKEEIGETYENLTGFLNLVAFVALLLGCIGVASAVHIYVREKLLSVAILRCLGGKGKYGFGIYLIQIVIMGLLGSILGAALGASIQFVLPEIFAGLLPVEVNLSISWPAIIQGVLIGLIISILFALLPLISIRKISPLRTIRASHEESEGSDPLQLIIIGLVVVFVGIFSYFQLGEWDKAALFTLGVVVAFLLLGGIAKLMMWAVKKYFPTTWHYVWRQSLSNLYRPNNQTLILIVTIGLGTALISTLFFVQNLLLEKVELTAKEDQPNMVLFDIQDDQEESLVDLTRNYDLPILQRVPIVSMRMHAIKGMTIPEIREDTSQHIRGWVLNREYRVTYRDSLTDSETITKGKWRGEVKSPQDTVWVSLEDDIAEDMKVDIGDKVTFNVQGAIIETYVGSIREVDWQRVQTNFLVVFPRGVLEQAPKFHVLITRVESNQKAATFQQAVVKSYPNVSVIDLQLILKTIDEIVSKVSFVIRFMAFFSIITGIIVLIGSVIISKFQRIQESVLLRTIGASRRQILNINALEYFFLGSLATFTGVIIALIASWVLAQFSFETPFSPTILPVVLTYFIITSLTVLIGLSNSREIVNNPPLEVLRKEV
ncbi:putative ABC transport system permease protein [Catalinimonas alkaloidigena]|uniref:ABC transporter permease n=1 Tax=Catalinimonas alkaloidigena TaxID=1075417 RepID=UPI0024051469|nr:FtsX-like permease family protein [Catalinimonas alkaloidigena]MDF9796149.1 putative ABC transport system permease protein [Catalinimonas alkaloidigena]